MKNGLFKRLLVTLLSALLVVTSLPVTSFAAPANNAETTSVYSELDNEKIAYDAYQALLKAVRTGKDSDFIAAYQLILKLTPTQRVHFFIHRYKDIYKALQKKGIYSFFDPEKYLSENPDVFALAKQKNVDPVEFALEHYLSDGIFEGRSSCTDFDPIIAIVAYPDATLETIVSESKPTDKIVEDLRKAFTQASGDETTEGYSIGSLKPLVETTDNTKPEDTYILIVGKPGEPDAVEVAKGMSGLPIEYTPQSMPTTVVISGQTAPAGDGSSSSQGAPSSSQVTPSEGGGSSEPASGPQPTGRPIPTTPPATPTPTPTATPTPEPPTGPSRQVVMVYLCGSNLENSTNPSASKCIMEMLKSAFSSSGSTEVYVLAGGATEWFNPVLQADLGGDNRGKVALYKLDSSHFGSLPSDVKPADVLNTSNVVKQTDFVIGEGEDNNVSMGDANTLTKFVDYVTAKSDTDQYSLILWDHGGGFSGTICSDENHLDGEDNDGLFAEELVTAFNNMDYIANKQKKFSLLGFDACLMGQYELAYTLSPYYTNMIATPQIETGDWDYKGTLARIDAFAQGSYSSRKQFMGDLLTNIANSGAHGMGQGRYMPFTCFDSSEFAKKDDNDMTINACIEDMGTKMTALLQYDGSKASTAEGNKDVVELYQAIRKARALTTIYGNDEKLCNYDYLDMGELLYNMKQQISPLVTKYPDNTAYRDLLDSINAIISHMENDAFVYLSSAYRDNGNLYKTGAVGHETYKDFPNVYRYSDFYRALGLSDKMLGVSIFAPIKTTISDSNFDNRYKALGLEEYGKFLKAYDNVASSYIYSGTDDNGTPFTYTEKDRIKMLQGYGWDSSAVDADHPLGNYTVNAANTVKFKDMANVAATGIVTVDTGKKSTKYIYVPLKTETAYAATTSGSIQYSSKNAAIDFTDTTASVAVYVSQYVDSSAKDNGGNYAGDVIVGNKAINLGNLSMGNDALMIGLDPYSSEVWQTTSYNVWGTGYQASYQLRDIATCFGSKNATEDSPLFGSSDGLFKYFKGMVTRIIYDDTDPSVISGFSSRDDADIYFLETTDSSGNTTYALKGVAIARAGDPSGAYDYYNKDTINYLSFYHYRVNEEDNKVETIERLTNDAGDLYDLNYNFYVNGVDTSGSTYSLADSYEVYIDSFYSTYGECMKDDKFAVGIINIDNDSMFTDNDKYYNESVFDVIGNNMVYDSDKYTEDNGHFGYYTKPENDSNPIEEQEVEPEETTMNLDALDETVAEEIPEELISEEVVADGELTEEIVTEEMASEEITPSEDNTSFEEETVSEVIEIQDYLEPEKIEVIKEDAYLGEEEDDDNDPETPDDVAA